jgi:REP element-mobilizing transposase RayT
MDENLHRRSIRLQGRDYSFPDRYFVTICTAGRKNILGRVLEGTMEENKLGQIARACWMEIPRHFANAELDAFVVMPNHVHGLICLKRALNIRGHDVSCPYKPSPVAAMKTAETKEVRGVSGEAFQKPARNSLPTIVRTYKAAVSRNARRVFHRSEWEIWQRNYYERVIRDDEEYKAAYRYVLENPLRWESDKENLEIPK